MSSDNNESAVPTWAALVLPFMQVVAEQDDLHRKEIMDRMALRLGLSDEALAERLNTGGSRFEQRVGWAMSNAAKAGWVIRPVRAHYRLTDNGRHWLQSDPSPLTLSSARSTFHEYWPEGQGETASSHLSFADPNAGAGDELVDPIEQIESGIERVQSAVADELLTRLRESHPDFFEEAVVQLLLAMGYGGAERRGKRIGGTGDGGIDGIIDQDALGLDRIYVQAKRYSEGNSVGREAIQAFVGALHGNGATRGVFITTSTFTSGAIEFARSIQLQVVLIDAERLTNLMIQYGVGVQVRSTYSVVEVDDDFFE